jgi:hypothetical protein
VKKTSEIHPRMPRKQATAFKEAQRVNPEGQSKNQGTTEAFIHFHYGYNAIRDLKDKLPSLHYEKLVSMMHSKTQGLNHLEILIAQGNFEEAVAFATEIIEKNSRFVFENSAGIGFSNFNDIVILQRRGLAALMLKKYESGIKDATEGLQLGVSMLSLTPPCEETWPCPSDPGVQMSNNMIRDLLNEQRCLLLEIRGRCSDGLGDMDGALADFRGLLALTYSNGLKPSKRLTQDILVLLGRMKAGSPRPYFTDAEICDWNEELRIKEYSEENRVCFNCGGRGRNKDSDIRLCGNCKREWFCGKSCFNAAFQIHAPYCRSRKTIVTVIPIEMEEQARSKIKMTGHYVVQDENGPSVIVQDSKTGVLHEVLSDQDVLFLSVVDPEAMREAVARHICEKLAILDARDSALDQKSKNLLSRSLASNQTLNHLSSASLVSNQNLNNLSTLVLSPNSASRQDLKNPFESESSPAFASNQELKILSSPTLVSNQGLNYLQSQITSAALWICKFVYEGTLSLLSIFCGQRRNL